MGAENEDMVKVEGLVRGGDLYLRTAKLHNYVSNFSNKIYVDLTTLWAPA